MREGGIFLLIHRMIANFGKLQGCTLALQDGLNILQAPNETGKSTWCAFLVSMLYGINSRERDKVGFIADKNRYAPWSGTAMSGRLDCRIGEQDITLSRSTRRQTAPMGEFQALYAGTGNAVPDLTGQTCGETLLGVSREVFERSAFIRQSGLAISQDAGLERRIASLITSGEEETSYTEATEALKKQLNRRRHNKTGQIPVLEAELQDLHRQIAEAEELARQLSASRLREESLSAQEAELLAELQRITRWEAAQQQAALTRAREAAASAAQTAEALRQRLQEERIPENDTISRLRGAIVNLSTARKAAEKARDEQDEAMKALLKAEAALNESPFAGQTPESARKVVAAIPVIRPKLWWLPLLAVPAALGIAYLSSHGNFAFSALVSSIAALLCFLFLLWRESSDKKKRSAYLAAFGIHSAAELEALADTYYKLYEQRETAQADLNVKTATDEALHASLTSNEQGILLEVRRFAPAAFDIPAADSALRSCAVRRKELTEAENAAREAAMRYDFLTQQTPALQESAEDIPTPARSREIVSAALDTMRANLAAVRSTSDRLTGQLSERGDPVVLHSAAEHTAEQIKDLEAEYDAIRLAMDALTEANTTLQNRFSPALGQRAAEIFGQLTDGQYSGVVLDRSFHLSAEPAGDTVYRDAGLLSAGTVDQLYLATRLAICDLVLPKEKHVPLILDDALTNFDDRRCEAALRWLKEESKHRQILLFTCHSREADFFAGDEEVSIQRLTDVV